MGLHVVVQLRAAVFDDLAGSQHAAGLSADLAASDHMLFDKEVVFRTEVLQYQSAHPLVPAHHDPAHSGAFCGQIVPVFIFALRIQKEAVPAVHAQIRVHPAGHVLGSVIAAELYAVCEQFERSGLRIHQMRLKQFGSRLAADLLGAHIDIFEVGTNIQKNIRSL